MGSYIHHSIIKSALNSTSFVLFHSNTVCCDVMEIVYDDGARVESIELLLKGEGSRVSVNQKKKLEQLRQLSLTEQ